MQDKQKMYQTFYSGALKGGFGTFNTGSWSQVEGESDEEDEDEEAEFERDNFTVEDGLRGRSNAHFNN